MFWNTGPWKSCQTLSSQVLLCLSFFLCHILVSPISSPPTIHFIQTINLTTTPGIVTGWHSLCLAYFSYKFCINQRTEISKFLMSLHQLPAGCSIALFAPAEWTSGFIIGQRSVTFPGHLQASLGKVELNHPTCIHWPHGEFSPFVFTHPVLIFPTKMEHYCILYFNHPPTQTPSFFFHILLCCSHMLKLFKFIFRSSIYTQYPIMTKQNRIFRNLFLVN